MTNKRTPDPNAVPPEGLVVEPPSGDVLPGDLARAAVGEFYGSGGKAAAPDSEEERDAEVRAASATTRAHTDAHSEQGDPHSEE